VDRGRFALTQRAATRAELDQRPDEGGGDQPQQQEKRPFQLLPFTGARGDRVEAQGGDVAGRKTPEPRPPISLAERTAALQRALSELHRKWGHGAVRLGADDSASLASRGPDAKDTSVRARELPAWWPRPGTRPRPLTLELVGDRHGAPLSLALSWLAAAQPALAAVIEEPGAVRFHGDAAAGAGAQLDRLVVVRPPPGDARAVLDAAVVLLRSEAFDVVLCPLPLGEKTAISTGFANKLATLAIKAGTTLLLLTGPRGRSLGAAAEYRIRTLGRRWVWEHGELAGTKLRVAAERARAAGGADLGAAGDLAEHEITLRLHRRTRHGPATATRIGIAAEGALEDVGDRARGSPDRLHLAAAVRIARGEQSRPTEGWGNEAIAVRAAR
jgi:hypothetical protein